MSQQYISDFEHGLCNPTTVTLYELPTALGVGPVGRDRARYVAGTEDPGLEVATPSTQSHCPRRSRPG